MDAPIKHIALTNGQWTRIKHQLVEEFGPKVMIRWVMRRELGFDVRQYDDWRNGEHYHAVDFYNEPAKTWFLLKFGFENDQDPR